jgi:aldehyde:ferredoxin oxidoreductase
VLWVDLTRGRLQEQSLPEEAYGRWLAGLGLALHLTAPRIPAGADPLGPENVLGFAAGLLTGTGSLFSGRWTVTGKSPLTGGWGDANCGGHFAPAIKRSGYDAIFFTGASPSPVYLRVDNGRAELRDARPVWGQDTFATEARLTAEAGGKRFRVACIGPAGERRPAWPAASAPWSARWRPSS